MTNDVNAAIKKTVQSFPQGDGFQIAYNNQWVLNLATVADGFTQWGQSVRQRDIELRNFFPTEPILAGAVGKVSSRNAAQSITFDGPPRTVKAVQEMWNTCNFGKGPQHLLMQVSTDLYTQDNGAFIELIRQGQSETSPVISIAHLDASQCVRTGNPETPVIYIDPRNGSQHRLGYHQVITLEEMPSPIETMNGVGYCALTRIFRAAQIMRDLNILDAEKVGGRHTRRITLVSGVAQSLIDDSQVKAQDRANNQGLLRYIQPVILASLDPTATVQKVDIDLAMLPDGFDRDQAFRQYIATLALGFLEDYQMFAPLPAGNLGTSTQSEVLARKTRGTGPALFNKILIQALMYGGVFPNSVEVTVQEKDSKADQDEANVAATRATTRAARIASTEITPAVARQIAVDDGDLQQEYLHVMGEQDVTEDVTVTDDERAETEIETEAGISPVDS